VTVIIYIQQYQQLDDICNTHVCQTLIQMKLHVHPHKAQCYAATIHNIKMHDKLLLSDSRPNFNFQQCVTLLN